MLNLWQDARRKALKSISAFCVWCLGRWPLATSWLLDRIACRAVEQTYIGNGDHTVEEGWWLGDYWIGSY